MTDKAPRKWEDFIREFRKHLGISDDAYEVPCQFCGRVVLAGFCCEAALRKSQVLPLPPPDAPLPPPPHHEREPGDSSPGRAGKGKRR